MVLASTMDMSASMVYGVWSTVIQMVVGLTPTEQASSAPAQVGMQAQVRATYCRSYYQATIDSTYPSYLCAM